MKLTSPAFKDGDYYPMIFTYDGPGLSPPLEWSDFPPNTESFALTFKDMSTGKFAHYHWVVANIPKKVTSLPQGGPVPGQELVNSAGNAKYVEPMPPAGTHTYIFTVYAMPVGRVVCANKNQLFDRIREKALDHATLTVKYQRLR